MKPEVKKCLYDIKMSILSINEFISGDMNFLAFQNSKLTRRAVERELEIIGEATNRLLKIDPEFKIANARKIVDTRNWVIHSYDSVDSVIIWGIIINHLPNLLTEVDQYLSE